MTRYIVDTNVLLHAAFIESYELNAIELIRRRGDLLVINDWILSEAERRLNVLSWALRSSFQPLEHLREFIRSHNILVIPYSPVIDGSKINRADSWVVASAIEHNAIVLTEDIPLAIECKKQNVGFEVARNLVSTDSDIFLIGDSLPRHRAEVISDRKDGTVFVKIKTGIWSNQIGTSYVIDFCGLEIFYNRADCTWFAGMGDRKPIAITRQAPDDNVIDIYFCWRGARDGRLGEEFLMICPEGRDHSYASRATSRKQSVTSHDTLHLGNDRNGLNQLNGYIQQVTATFKYIGSSNIGKAHFAGTYPLPKSGNELRDALAHLDAALAV